MEGLKHLLIPTSIFLFEGDVKDNLSMWDETVAEIVRGIKAGQPAAAFVPQARRN